MASAGCPGMFTSHIGFLVPLHKEYYTTTSSYQFVGLLSFSKREMQPIWQYDWSFAPIAWHAQCNRPLHMVYLAVLGYARCVYCLLC